MNKTSVANPVNCRSELMVMIRGLEELAAEKGETGVFVTLTTPSRYHARTRVKQGSVANRHYDGSTPREAQQWLTKTWAKIRAELDRQSIDPYGYRVAEPHHDGTPHWHLLLFMPASQIRDFNRVMKAYSYDGETLNKEQKKARYEMKILNPKTGKAAGYIAKYISKNIDGFAIGDLMDEETGGPMHESVYRVAAWKACWGIRQFQQIGGAGKTIWRELRKITKEKMQTYQRQLNEEEAWTKEELAKVEEIRTAADASNYRYYTVLQGGPHVKRAEQTVQLWREESNIPGKYQTMIAKLFGGVFYSGIEQLKGIFLLGAKAKNKQLTRYYEWVIRRKTEDDRKEAQRAFSCSGNM